jgi:AcrR family transcriptional regulator
MPRTIDLGARRIQLAEATWRVIREKGVGAVSVRTIAAEAGVVVGSLRHVFPTRAELLEFSARLMIDRATERIAAIEPTGDAVEDAIAVLRELLPLTADTRAELEVNLALIGETPALPQLAGLRDEADAALRSLCAALVRRVRASGSGSADARAAAAGSAGEGPAATAPADGRVVATVPGDGPVAATVPADELAVATAPADERVAATAPADELAAERLFALVDGLALHLLIRPDEDMRERALSILRAEVGAIARARE